MPTHALAYLQYKFTLHQHNNTNTQAILAVLGALNMFSWWPRCDVPPVRRASIALAYLVCSAPMLARGDYARYGMAVGSMLAGSLFFACNHLLHNWGHFIFHLALLPFIYMFLLSANLADLEASN